MVPCLVTLTRPLNASRGLSAITEFFVKHYSFLVFVVLLIVVVVVKFKNS